MSEFVAAREKGVVPMKGGMPFKNLASDQIRLKEENGPTLLVDLEGTVVFWYFPKYIGKGLQVRSMRSHDGYRCVLTDRKDNFLR